MPQYRRPRIGGASIFFTVSLAQPGGKALVAHIARLRAAVALTRAERPFAIEAWVVLPDHLHCIWTLPPGDSDYATRWRLIKARFSRGLPPGPRRLSHLRRGERGIWQRRFWEHHIRDPQDFAHHVSLCWHDPVRHGLVALPQDWPFTSLHRRVPVGCVLSTHPTPLAQYSADRAPQGCVSPRSHR